MGISQTRRTDEASKQQGQQPSIPIVHTEKENGESHQQKEDWIETHHLAGGGPRCPFTGLIWAIGAENGVESQGLRRTGAADGDVDGIARMGTAPHFVE